MEKTGRRCGRGGTGGRRRPGRDDEEEDERRIGEDLTVESRDLERDPERQAIVFDSEFNESPSNKGLKGWDS